MTMPLKVRCPICKTPTLYDGNPYRPFCSERCKKRDLGAWASDEYAISGGDKEVEENSLSTSDEEGEAPPNGPLLH